MILHLCLWIFFIPALKEKLEISVYKNKEMQAAVSLSPGYFRVSQDNRYVLYYSEVDSENNASGVCIDKSKSNGNVFTFSSEKPAIFQDEFSDPLIKNTVEMPVLLKQILKYFQKFTVSSYSTVVFALFAVISEELPSSRVTILPSTSLPTTPANVDETPHFANI